MADRWPLLIHPYGAPGWLFRYLCTPEHARREPPACGIALWMDIWLMRHSAFARVALLISLGLATGCTAEMPRVTEPAQPAPPVQGTPSFTVLRSSESAIYQGRGGGYGMGI